MMLPYTSGLAVWSSSSRFIAVAKSNTVSVDILDSAALQRLQSLWVPRERVERPKALVFSPDSRMLSCASFDSWSSRFVSTWDLQTGCLASSIGLPSPSAELLGDCHITYSMVGKMVGVPYRDDASPTISVVDVMSGVRTHDIHPCTPWTYSIWTHGESLRFVTIEWAEITIWEAEFTQGATQRKTETISVPDDADRTRAFNSKARRHIRRQEAPWHLGQAQFFPFTSRLAFTRASSGSTEELLVWDPRSSMPLLYRTAGWYYPRMAFSSDGRFFACSITRLEVHLWKESFTGYEFIGELPSNTRCSIPLLSPNGESIITFANRTIHLWHTNTFSTPSGISAHVPDFDEDFVLELVPDRQLAVVARQGGTAATILHLKSGLPQLTIDASLKIYGLRVPGNAVAVIGDGVIITGDLPEGNSLPRARVNVENSIQTTLSRCGGQSDVIIASISPDLHYDPTFRQPIHRNPPRRDRPSGPSNGSWDEVVSQDSRVHGVPGSLASPPHLSYFNQSYSPPRSPKHIHSGSQ